MTTPAGQHTPGPWAISKQAKHVILSDVHPRKAICCMKNTHAEDWEANARLIAQAPAMLDVIRAIIYASDGCQGHRGCNHSMQPWQDARALLATLDA